MKILLCLTIAGLIFISCSEDSNSPEEYYKLTMSVLGEGSYDVFPVKDEYKDGESVTITATADTGWRFKKWEGSISTNYNPLQLTMDGNKSVRAVFVVPFEPVMTGKWTGVEFNVTFNVTQTSIFDSTLTGTLVLTLNNGSTLQYSVTGYNRPPAVLMNCDRPGYYQITYAGWWADNTHIDGELIEAGYHYACDLVKATDSPLPKEGKSLNPKRIVE